MPAQTREPASAFPAASERERDPVLAGIRDKALAGRRLSIDEGMALYGTSDLWGLCALAHEIRTRLHGDAAYYNVNRHVNYTNVCALSCSFCGFYRKQGQPGAYSFSPEQIAAEAAKASAAGATEIHIVGGLHPYEPFGYYTDMLRAIRAAAPRIHIKAFTAVEIVHLARIAKVYQNDDRKAGIRWVLQRLVEAGLGSLPGGGAEVFDDRVHDEAFKGKIRSDVWLDVHRVAHELGLNTNATILYGHIESRRERLVHMDMLRRAQDEALARLGFAGEERGGGDGGAAPITLTAPGAPQPAAEDPGYFQAIIPLPFVPDGTALARLPGPSGVENLRTIAVARLMADNTPHVKAFWIMQTLAMSQLMLRCGADDIDGTVVWYDITKVGGVGGAGGEGGGGGGTHQEVGVWELQRAIREAGLRPVERDTLYRRVERDEDRWRVASV